MKSAILQECLDTIDRQRQGVFARAQGISTEDLWQRPGNERWSIGQNLEHLTKAMQLFRWAFALTYPVGLPFAVAFRRKPFTSDIANPYEHRPKPVAAPLGVRPRDRRPTPLSLALLEQGLARQRDRFQVTLSGMHEAIAGHIKVWDPPVGMVNLLQLARLVAHHEAHHFRFVHDLLDRYEANRAGSSFAKHEEHKAEQKSANASSL
jgi:hypothetical protein